MRKLKAYLRPSLTTFCRIFFLSHARKMEKSTSQQQFPVFSAVYTDTYVRGNIHLTYSRTMSSKNPEKSLQRSESHLFRSTAKETNRKLLRLSTKTKRMPFLQAGEFADSNPVALQRTVWWFLSLHFGFQAGDESRKLRWGDVQLQQQNDGQEVLVWLAE